MPRFEHAMHVSPFYLDIKTNLTNHDGMPLLPDFGDLRRGVCSQRTFYTDSATRARSTTLSLVLRVPALAGCSSRCGINYTAEFPPAHLSGRPVCDFGAHSE